MSSMLLSGPAVEPVTIEEAKAFLRVEHDDDDVIAALIAGARVHVEAETRRADRAHWYENRGLITPGSGIAVLPQTVAAMLTPYRLLSL